MNIVAIVTSTRALHVHHSDSVEAHSANYFTCWHCDYGQAYTLPDQGTSCIHLFKAATRGVLWMQINRKHTVYIPHAEFEAHTAPYIHVSVIKLLDKIILHCMK